MKNGIDAEFDSRTGSKVGGNHRIRFIIGRLNPKVLLRTLGFFLFVDSLWGGLLIYRIDCSFNFFEIASARFVCKKVYPHQHC